jgi:hypothetical protein
MKGLDWMPDDQARNQKIDQYLERVNHAPYLSILLFAMAVFCLFAGVILISVF